MNNYNSVHLEQTASKSTETKHDWNVRRQATRDKCFLSSQMRWKISWQKGSQASVALNSLHNTIYELK